MIPEEELDCPPVEAYERGRGEATKYLRGGRLMRHVRMLPSIPIDYSIAARIFS